ncbi:MAG: hypothetical protein ACPGQL_07415 [Thermoplasmatota archaeon]
MRRWPALIGALLLLAVGLWLLYGSSFLTATHGTSLLVVATDQGPAELVLSSDELHENVPALARAIERADIHGSAAITHSVDVDAALDFLGSRSGGSGLPLVVQVDGRFYDVSLDVD